MNRAQRRAGSNGSDTIQIDPLLTIYKDPNGQLKCNLKEGMRSEEARALLGTFMEVYSYKIIDEKIEVALNRPKPSLIHRV